MERTKVLATAEEVLSALRGKAPGYSAYKAFYNSRLNAVVTDPVLMQVPIDDHMVHRSHAVTGSVLIVRKKAFLLQNQLLRLQELAQRARIELPMTCAEIGLRLKQVAACTGLSHCTVNYWLSSGPGNMAIWPEPHCSVLYALAISTNDPISDLQNCSFKHDVTVQIAVRAEELATVKWLNPLVDAMTCAEAREKGGCCGIEVDVEGYVTGCARGNVALLLPGNRFVTPLYDKLLTKSLIPRVFEHAQALHQLGLLSSVSEQPISLAEAQTALEVIECHETSLTPLASWDDHALVSTQLWPLLVARMTQDWESQDTHLLEPI